MAGSSRNATPTKRLMTELQTYQSDPNDALLELGPTDDDVMHWRAVMKGVVGTAYEGKSRLPYSHRPASPPAPTPMMAALGRLCTWLFRHDIPSLKAD